MKNISSRKLGLFGGLFLLAIIMLLPTPEGMTPEAKSAAGVALLMTVWWVTEAIPIYATAFVPLALYPLLNILPAGQTAENYGHNYVLMLLAGFIIAKSIEMQNLHKRIALVIVKTLGTSRQRIILGFMIATAFLSMWIANVAVALLMLPIAIAIINKEESETKEVGKFGLALMLAIAYAASVGGTGTLIGTPPNMVFAGMMDKLYPDAPEISFFAWMKVGIPLVIIFIPVIWFYIIKYFKIKGSFSGSSDVVGKEIKALGSMSVGEKRVAIIFALTAIGWIFRRDFVFDNTVVPGWATLIGVGDFAHDSTVAMVGALLLFMLPAGKSDKYGKAKRLMDWKSAGSIPWGVVMIVGGGYAIADSFKETGLADWIGGKLAFVGQYPTLIILLAVVGLMIFLTEINSNTATANIFLPVLATMAVAGGTNPLLLMIPATFACSFAFMMPSGTGTNTVIFASERVKIPDMAKCGLWLNLISLFLLTLLLYTVVIPAFGISSEVPIWAK